MNLLKEVPLTYRMTIPTIFLVVFITILSSSLYYDTLEDTVHKQVGNRALALAEKIAALDEVHKAFATEQPWLIIQPIAEAHRVISGAEFIVVGNEKEIRYSHTNPEKIGKKMVGGDNERALLYGESYVSEAVGTLGPSIRGKVPIINGNGAIIGIVSVGFLKEDINEVIGPYVHRMIFIAIIASLVGIFGALLLARSIKKSLSGHEPEAISALYKEREAVIQSVREGIIVVNKEGIIVLVNQAACDILTLPRSEDIIGKPLSDYIVNSTILEVIATGEAQLNRALHIREKDVIVNRLPVKSNENVIGVVSSFRLQSEIEHLREELTQVKLYTEVLRAQTHEFNNLLYTLSGLLQLESYTEAMELIHHETEVHKEMSQFIIQKIKEPMLSGIILGFYNRARELKVELTLDQESSLDRVPSHITISHLVSILGNLIMNAFEAVEHREEQNRKARLFITDLGDDVLIEIEDTGEGISDHILPYIFKQGYSTKKGDNRGNGLARIHDVVHELEGTISIEEGQWGGALFIIALPKKRGD